MKITDKKVIAEVKMQVWDEESASYSPDWSQDYFTAGSLVYNDDLEAYEVENIQDYVDSAKIWADGNDEGDADLRCEIGDEAFDEQVENRSYDVTYYSIYGSYNRPVGYNTYDEAVKAPKYFLDPDNGHLYTIREHDLVWSGSMADAGIESDEDDMWQTKLDAFFQAELNISPSEWEVG